MAEKELDSERGRQVTIDLKALGVTGILITAAELGYITERDCAMPRCFCPDELGGAGFVEQVGDGLTDWMPTPDHHPIMKKDGGHLDVDNVRLAHRLCNRVDYSIQVGRPYEKDLARVEAAREDAIRRAGG